MAEEGPFIHSRRYPRFLEDAGGSRISALSRPQSFLKCPVCNFEHQEVIHQQQQQQQGNFTPQIQHACSHGCRVVFMKMKCPICFEDEEPPVVALPCGHGVCKTCFEQLGGRTGEAAERTRRRVDSTRRSRYTQDLLQQANRRRLMHNNRSEANGNRRRQDSNSSSARHNGSPPESVVAGIVIDRLAEYNEDEYNRHRINRDPLLARLLRPGLSMQEREDEYNRPPSLQRRNRPLFLESSSEDSDSLPDESENDDDEVQNGPEEDGAREHDASGSEHQSNDDNEYGTQEDEPSDGSMSSEHHNSSDDESQPAFSRRRMERRIASRNRLLMRRDRLSRLLPEVASHPVALLADRATSSNSGNGSARLSSLARRRALRQRRALGNGPRRVPAPSEILVLSSDSESDDLGAGESSRNNGNNNNNGSRRVSAPRQPGRRESVVWSGSESESDDVSREVARTLNNRARRSRVPMRRPPPIFSSDSESDDVSREVARRTLNRIWIQNVQGRPFASRRST